MTRAITTEIETARGRKQLTKRIVETLPKEDFEWQSYLNCDRMTYVFLHSTPRSCGIHGERDTMDGICKIFGPAMSSHGTNGREILWTNGTAT